MFGIGIAELVIILIILGINVVVFLTPIVLFVWWHRSTKNKDQQ